MLDHIIHNKKIKYYLLILSVLWIGAAANSFVSYPDSHWLRSVNMQSAGNEPTVLLKDEYAGNLSKKKKEKIIQEMLEHFEAKTVNAIKNEELYTVYAYTPLIKNTITTNHQKINLNILYTYNDITDITTLIVATPIYNQDY